jgi:hypothetical protein
MDIPRKFSELTWKNSDLLSAKFRSIVGKIPTHSRKNS